MVCAEGMIFDYGPAKMNVHRSKRRNFDKHLKRIGPSCRAKGLIGIEDFVEFEAMRDQLIGIDPMRLHSLEQHRRSDGVDEPGCDRDVTVPQQFQMQIRLDPVHADIGDDAARRHDILAGDKARRHANRLDGRINTAAAGHLHDFFDRFAVLVVDDCCCPKAGGQLQAVVIHIDHDDLCGRVELRCEQRSEPDGAGAYDGDGRAGLNLAVEHTAFESCGQDVAQHDKGVFVGTSGNVIETGIGERRADKFRLSTVDCIAEDPAAIDAMRIHTAAAIVAFSARRDA